MTIGFVVPNLYQLRRHENIVVRKHSRNKYILISPLCCITIDEKFQGNLCLPQEVKHLMQKSIWTPIGSPRVVYRQRNALCTSDSFINTLDLCSILQYVCFLVTGISQSPAFRLCLPFTLNGRLASTPAARLQRDFFHRRFLLNKVSGANSF